MDWALALNARDRPETLGWREKRQDITKNILFIWLALWCWQMTKAWPFSWQPFECFKNLCPNWASRSCKITAYRFASEGLLLPWHNNITSLPGRLWLSLYTYPEVLAGNHLSSFFTDSCLAPGVWSQLVFTTQPTSPSWDFSGKNQTVVHLIFQQNRTQLRVFHLYYRILFYKI